jgi:phospholipid transport system substrate-binding protein
MRAALMLFLAVSAAEGGGGATAALKERDAEIRAVLPPSGGTVTPEARKKIETIVTRVVDLRGMLQAAMGPRWNQISEAQRKRLIGAFESRFRQLSSSELDTYRSTDVQYMPEAPAGEGAVKVPTRVVVKGEPTEIVYTMRHEKGGWRIIDLTVDGVSTVENYRSSFNRIIAKEGVDGLVKRLERGSGPQRAEAK